MVNTKFLPEYKGVFEKYKVSLTLFIDKIYIN